MAGTVSVPGRFELGLTKYSAVPTMEWRAIDSAHGTSFAKPKSASLAYLHRTC